jgi:hypothetical protein
MPWRCPECDSPRTFEVDEDGYVECQDCGTEFRAAGSRRAIPDDDYDDRPGRRRRRRDRYVQPSSPAAVGSLVAGVIGCVFFCVSFISIPLGILGVGLAVTSRNSSSRALAASGFVLSATALIFGIGFAISIGAGIVANPWQPGRSAPPFFPGKQP